MPDLRSALSNAGKVSKRQFLESEARKLLLQSPSLVHEIITIAHQRGMQAKHKRGGGRLIANLLQLRGELSRSSLSDGEKVQIVNKTFSNK